jgi:vitamin B12 transporter
MKRPGKLHRLAAATALLPALAAAAPARAQEPLAFNLEAITISANRTATARARSGTSVSVVTASDLARQGDATVATYLSRLPGVSLSTQGPFGNEATLRIRGADTRYIAVLIDGIRVGDPSATEVKFNFGALLTADVGRIEVLRGSQSALYGGSAVGGVVDITSRRPTEEGVSQDLAVEGGSYGTARLSYSLAQRQGALETTLSLAHLTTQGFSAAASGTEDDAAEATRLSLGARYALSPDLTIGGNVFHQRTEQEFDGFPPPTFTLADQDNTQVRTETGARVFAEWQQGATAHVFDVTRYRIVRDFDEAGALSSFEGARTGASWTATTTLSDSLALQYGADTAQEVAKYANAPGGRSDSRTSGVFGQVLWSPSDTVDLSATLRRDDISDFGGFTTGRLAVAFRPAEGTTLRASVARGFRAPSLDERFGDYSAFGFVGNPNLTPEESQSYDLGIEQGFANGATLSATLFRLEIENLIASNSTFSSLVNQTGTSVRKGLELEGRLPLSAAVTLTAAYTYTDAKRASGARLGFVPRHEVVLGVEAQVGPATTAVLSVKHAADRLNDFGTAALGDYTVVNLQVARDVGNDTEVYLRAENLFDEDYELSEGFATAGQSFYVGLRKTF